MARVCVDVPLPHLDRLFDYLVPAELHETALPGTRVKVRFAGQLVDGWLIARAAASDVAKLAWLDRLVSPERVLTDEVAGLARAVADRYAGSLADVLRLAVPPRHARAEQSRPAPAPAAAPAAAPAPAPAAATAAAAADPPPTETGSDGRRTTAPAPDDMVEARTSADRFPPPTTDIPRDASLPAVGAAGDASLSAGGATGAASLPPAEAVGDASLTAAGAAADASVPAAGGTGDASLSAAGTAGGGSVPAAGGTGDASLSAAGTAGGGSVPAAGGTGDASLPAADPTGGVSPLAVDRAGGVPSLAVDSVGGASAPVVDPGGWSAYTAGGGFLRALADGRAPRAVWSALPGEDWPARIAEAAAVTAAAGRGVVAVVPDARDLDRLDAALAAALGKGRHVALAAGLGPAKRYRAFLAASRGEVRVVAGTRAAMFAPVADLGLVVIWDDGDDLHAEPRAPYPHAREVLLTRAQRAGAAALVAGYARTAEAQLLLDTGWAREIAADRATTRRRTPAIAPTGDDPQLARDPAAATARLPSLAWDAARAALRAGAPVLVQVPRRGYLPAVSCATCRAAVRCAACAGPLALRSSHAVPACRWCGRVAGDHVCPHCGGRALRAAVTGARRTAEELGRAFPETPVRTSGRDEILTEVPAAAAVVVATPGAEPAAEGGYGAVLLLDTWALLTRADLRAGEEALRRWMAAAALAKPASAGGRVVVVADGAVPVVQALLRWDPAWYAARELAERRELRFPPAARMTSLTGTPEAVADLLAAAHLPAEAEVLGPVPAAEGQERFLVRASRARAADVARALHDAAGVRSARKSPDAVRVQVDATDLF